MKLAEALILRADLQKRICQLKVRLKNSAKVQEGDEPAEDMSKLFAELDTMMGQLEDLMFLINQTNMLTSHEGETLTHMMAHKDALTLRLSVLRDLLEHLTVSDSRYSRNEIKFVRTVDVAALHRSTDDYSKQLRELDTKIQGLNWTVDLVEA